MKIITLDSRPTERNSTVTKLAQSYYDRWVVMQFESARKATASQAAETITVKRSQCRRRERFQPRGVSHEWADFRALEYLEEIPKPGGLHLGRGIGDRASCPQQKL
jgi:hypothetical protein